MNQARSSSQRLTARLEQASALSGLSRRELVAAQRNIRRLERAGVLPNPTEYWQHAALPRAAILVDASMAAVEDEGQALGEAIRRFVHTCTHGELRRWAGTEAGRTAVKRGGEQAVSLVADAVAPSPSIHALGLWWQRRLRRSAIIRSLPRLATAGADFESRVGKAELALLDGAPWCHGDRLLAAFEIAHGEIRTQADVVAEELRNLLTTTRAVSKAADHDGRQSQQTPVTIELRS